MLQEQLRQKMLDEGIDKCDVVEFVINGHVVVAFGDDIFRRFSNEVEAEELQIYPNYLDWWASRVK